MANYLPVLLVSVTSNPSLNAIPDDLSLETLPRGQVDYLSHEWAEEDVWRSWRNMTRQKNEIANGKRLENASWRTWWKQRNKLKTVTPETLNWLKDSDVTWLYGPLHTAVDWTPPPKPKPSPTSVEKDIPSSALDRLDLSTLSMPRRKTDSNFPTNETKQKSILKYRSISELLMSDLPAGISPRFGMSPQGSDDESDPEDAQVKSPKRPALSHTKSDTHVATLGSASRQALAAMGLRKDSPPRIGPSDHVRVSTDGSSSSSLVAANSSGDSSDLARDSSPSGSVSPDSQSRANGSTPHDITSAAYGRQKRKHKHIAFNTFVEQCIAIEKPKKSRLSSRSNKPKRLRHGLGYETTGNWNGKTRGTRWDGVEDEEDEDEEHGDDFDESSESSDDSADMEQSPYVYYPYTQRPSPSSWYPDECAIDSSDESDADHDEDVFEDDEDDGLQDILDDDDDGIIEMRPSVHTAEKPPNRSESRVSNSSSSSTTSTSTSALSNSSTAETSPSPARDKPQSPRRRRSRKSASEQPLHHRLSTSSQSSNATIIARRKSFSLPSYGSRLARRKDSNSAHSHITIAPIAPTMLKTTGVGNAWDGFGSGYGHQYRPSHSGGWIDGFGDDGYSDDGVTMKWYPGRRPSGDSNSSSDVGTPVELVYVPPIGRYGNRRIGDDEDNADREYHHQEAYFTDDNSQQRAVPIVVRTPPVREVEAEEDAYDYLGGPDLGEDFVRKPSYRRKPGTRESSRSSAGDSREEDTQRSTSRSKSRTPSPNDSTAVTSPDRDLSPTLLSPPLRGRAVFQPQQESVSRGRSSTRTSSSSLSDRDRSAQTSPIGSLSPDGTAIGIGNGVYGVYANGRIDRERERDRERGQAKKGKERGRERTERRLDHSSSPIDSAMGNTEQPTPSNSPVITFSSSSKISDSLQPTYLTAPMGPSTSVTSTSAVPKLVSGRGSSTSPPKISNVSRAIGMVSSTGAYFGLWPTDGRA